MPGCEAVTAPRFVPGLVSIVVVGHNNWPELETAIQSGLRQSYRPVEVVVVDNESTDQTSTEVPRRFGDSVRYVRQSNTGDGGGYNRGISESRGEFVHLLDGDDLMAPNMIEKQIAMLEEDASIDAVYGDVRHFLGEPGVAPDGRWQEFSLRDYDDLLAALIRADDHGLMVPTAMLFRRATIERVGPFIARDGHWEDIWWQVDREYLLRCAHAGCRFRHSPGALLFYRIHGKQMTADSAGMDRGMDALMERSAKMVTREPYHGMLQSLWARRLWSRAVSAASRRGEALRTLRRARIADPGSVTLPRYLIGLLLILVPGGAWAYRVQQRLRSPRP